ncbi:MAG: hypothetical protein JST73_01740 [Actinobacteria bacterium]|nr:hypothetical protein [Actinomycetota bacterium]
MSAVPPTGVPLDPARFALAIDAICVGCVDPILIHVETEPERRRAAAAIFCTPLEGLGSLDATLDVLGALRVPARWRVAGLCAPVTVHLRDDVDTASSLGAWIVHVVDDHGGAASRLCVPDRLDVSGPMNALDSGTRLHRCLDRLVGGSEGITDVSDRIGPVHLDAADVVVRPERH